MILLADPDDTDRSLLSYVLSREGFAVLEADNAETTLQIARSGDVTLAILAMAYWQVGATNLLAMISHGEKADGLPVLLFGQPQSREEIRRAVRNGACGLIVRKGFNIEGFIAKVRSTIRSERGGEHATGRYGGMVAPADSPAPPPPSAGSMKDGIEQTDTDASSSGWTECSRTPQAEKRYQKILEIIEGLDVLPTTTIIPLRILQLQRKPSATLFHFAEVLSADSALCAKIIALANSAWFSPDRTITELSHAVRMMGLNNLLPLVLGLSLASMHGSLRLPTELSARLRESSLLKAVAAREYAARSVPSRAEDAYMCGLLQDIVLPIMYTAVPSAWERGCVAVDLENTDRKKRELQIYGADHCEFGRLLIRKLGLPTFYQEAAATHHDGAESTDVVEDGCFASSLAFAAAMPHHLTDWKRVSIQRLNTTIGRRAGADRHDVDVAALLDCVHHKYHETLSMLGESSESSVTFKQFVQEATGELARGLVSMIGQSRAMAVAFKTQQADMDEKIRTLEWRANLSDYDELTRVLNRRGFLKRAEGIFTSAREHTLGVGIGFVDLDDFKAVNDQHGHAMGDLVLKAVSEVLRDSVRDSSNVGRLGGDEFAFLITADCEKDASGAIDRISGDLTALKVVGEDATVQITLSVGVVWLGVPERRHSVQQAIEKADKLMYKAKRTGKAGWVVDQAGETEVTRTLRSGGDSAPPGENAESEPTNPGNCRQVC